VWFIRGEVFASCAKQSGFENPAPKGAKMASLAPYPDDEMKQA
jgi:hypothetical protein